MTHIGIAVIRFYESTPYINIIDYSCPDGLKFKSEFEVDSSSSEIKFNLKHLNQSPIYSSVKYYIVEDKTNPNHKNNFESAKTMIKEHHTKGKIKIASLEMSNAGSKDETELSISYSQKIQPKIDAEVQFDRNKDYFNSQLALIKTKSSDLDKRGHKKEAETVMELHDFLSKESIRYFDNPSLDGYKAFKAEASKAIHEAIPKLEHHRELWKPILANIGLAIAGLGVIYFIAVAINKGFFFNQTKSEKLMLDMEDNIETKLSM